ncbi:hypothetical protein [Providencia rettgeri]|uniref:hypothetical protein n=1 Tax=Providencia rettgeri TaxID=587 RepID=UPI001FB9BFD0|nr:hypothetical protein [Providencia rettgeri]
MNRFDQLMNQGKELEAKKLYRRAADKYNQAFSISTPGSPDGLSYQKKKAKQPLTVVYLKQKLK